MSKMYSKTGILFGEKLREYIHVLSFTFCSIFQRQIMQTDEDESSNSKHTCGLCCSLLYVFPPLIRYHHPFTLFLSESTKREPYKQTNKRTTYAYGGKFNSMLILFNRNTLHNISHTRCSPQNPSPSSQLKQKKRKKTRKHLSTDTQGMTLESTWVYREHNSEIWHEDRLRQAERRRKQGKSIIKSPFSGKSRRLPWRWWLFPEHIKVFP